MKKLATISSAVLMGGLLAACSTDNQNTANQPANNNNQAQTTQNRDNNNGNRGNNNNRNNNNDNNRGNNSNNNRRRNNRSDDEIGSADLGNTSVSLDDAVQTFQDSYPDTSLISISLQYDNRGPYYTVYGVDKNSEYQLTIDAESGEIINDWNGEFKNNRAKRWAGSGNALDPSGVITPQEAIEIAQSETGEQDVSRAALKRDRRGAKWEIEFAEINAREVEVELDASNGKVLEVDNDY